MEKEEDVYKRIGKNIAAYRRNAGITQAELARKINYSDKSVSKWESGNGVPDVLVLMRLAELFGVSVNDLVGESPKERASNTFMRVMVLLISSALIWLIATATFVAMKIFASAHGAWWLVFVYAIPANAAMLAVQAAYNPFRFDYGVDMGRDFKHVFNVACDFEKQRDRGRGRFMVYFPVGYSFAGGGNVMVLPAARAGETEGALRRHRRKRAFKKRGGSGQGKIRLSGGKRKRNVLSNGKSAVLYGAETGIMRGSGNG